MKNAYLFLLTALAFAGCIGTDLEDAPIVGKRLEISPDRIALLVGTSQMAKAYFYNEYGVPEEETTITWSAAPTNIATVDQNGNVTAVAPGQAKLFATTNELTDSVRIAVVLNASAAASVDITASKNSLNKGESIMVTTVVKNIDDVVITTSTLQWVSTDENVVTVDANGIVNAIGNGSATVYCIADGVYSNEILFSVGGLLTGSFVPLSGYMASGMVTLKLDNGELILELADNFTTSFALGTFIYLSNNNTSGTAVQAGGIELGQITTNGAHTFNVSALFPGTTLTQFQYVVILCKPANIPFGYAQLN